MKNKVGWSLFLGFACLAVWPACSCSTACAPAKHPVTAYDGGDASTPTCLAACASYAKQGCQEGNDQNACVHSCAAAQGVYDVHATCVANATSAAQIRACGPGVCE